ncbi:hypothetical protein chiPu_0028620, partial [Chiloscyllium punctatum]|nr:hypothetical protein [Chiloscyllium punctatum]
MAGVCFCSQLQHPNLLLLLSVCLSETLEQIKLVYERVGVGSLYTVLHKRSAEFSGLLSERIVQILFQICEAVGFLHCRGYLHRSLSSHAVCLITMDRAKLCNMEYMEG